MRGTKLTDWQEAEAWQRVRAAGKGEYLPETAEAQQIACKALARAQAAVARQVCIGIGDTIGLGAWLAPDGRGVWIDLPEWADVRQVAEALLAENITAWVCTDGRGPEQVEVGVAPWYTAEEIDHAILCVAKVCHVMLGIHSPTTAEDETGSACHVKWSSTDSLEA